MSQIMEQTIRKLSGFCKNINHLKLIKAKNGSCTAKLSLQESDLNPMGSMHGGFASALVYDVSSLSLKSLEKWPEPSRTVNMNISYLKAVQGGEEIGIECKLMKVGKNLAFLEVEIRNAAKELLVKAEHIKLRNSLI